MLVVLNLCKKETTKLQNNTSLLATIKLQLRDSLAENYFQQLDFNNAIISNPETNNFSILRIPFFNKSITTDFVLIKVEKNQKFSLDRIINLTRNQESNTLKKGVKFNGNISIYSLKRKLLIASNITDGYVSTFHQYLNNSVVKSTVVIVPLMPEIVLISSYPSSEDGG